MLPPKKIILPSTENIGIIGGIENISESKSVELNSEAIQKIFENIARKKTNKQIKTALSKLEIGDTLNYNGKQYRIIKINLDENQLVIESYNGKDRGPFIISGTTILHGKISAKGEAGKEIFFIGKIGDNVDLNIDYSNIPSTTQDAYKLTKYKVNKILKKI